MSYETLETSREDGVLTLTLSRPDRLNALNVQDARGAAARCSTRSTRTTSVRAVIVTGAGRAFCAGADLGGGGATFDTSRVKSDEPRDGGGRVTLRLYECKKPVIAAINGAAVGVGATMTLPMDVRIASEKARFGFVFARRGIVPEAASSWFLPRVVGISAGDGVGRDGAASSPREEALAGRLVSRVVPARELLPTARALAREIADNTSGVSVALARQMLWKMLGADHPMEAHKLDSRRSTPWARSPDAYEGVQSFLEKRPAAVHDEGVERHAGSVPVVAGAEVRVAASSSVASGSRARSPASTRTPPSA